MMTLAVIYFGVSLVFGGRLSVASSSRFQMFGAQLAGPSSASFHNVAGVFRQAEAIAGADRGHHQYAPGGCRGAITVNALKGEIIAKDITFRYAPDGPDGSGSCQLQHCSRNDGRYCGTGVDPARVRLPSSCNDSTFPWRGRFSSTA